MLPYQGSDIGRYMGSDMVRDKCSTSGGLALKNRSRNPGRKSQHPAYSGMGWMESPGVTSCILQSLNYSLHCHRIAK